MTARRIVVAPEAFVETALEWLLERLDRVLREQDTCQLMLAGGGTPLPIYRALASQAVPWERVVIGFGDERCVPVDHPASNYRAIMQALFPDGPPVGLRVQRMHGEDDPETAARAYAALLPPRIDILLLGIGEDGHTASLFPGSPALTEERRLVLPVIGSKPPPRRLTITPPVIRGARQLLMLAAGAGKAQAVRRALEEGDVPAALAVRGDWLIDRDAATLLGGHSSSMSPSGR